MTPDASLPEPKENMKKRKRAQTSTSTVGTSQETGAPEVAENVIFNVPTSHPDSDAEVEVLSHAAVRKRKRAKLVSDPPLPTSSNKNAENVAKSSSATKRQNSVWVGNLTFKTTTQQLREFFQFAGDITRIHMPTKAVAKANDKAGRTQNRGYVSSPLPFKLL